LSPATSDHRAVAMEMPNSRAGGEVRASNARFQSGTRWASSPTSHQFEVLGVGVEQRAGCRRGWCSRTGAAEHFVVGRAGRAGSWPMPYSGGSLSSVGYC
jgi:hypothetical protein